MENVFEKVKGFFKGIIDISAANAFPIIIKLNNSDFIKKNIF